MVGECTTTHTQRDYFVDGFKWLKAGLWSGFCVTCKKPDGFLTRVDRIFPVKSNGDWLFTSADKQDFGLAYIPPTLQSQFVREKNGEKYVDYSDAQSFLIPERQGGTDGKFVSGV